ncbi:MAG TPA: GDSL-type esterase/lipase family protein [Candidatus Saccharimonadales bacterium]
MGSLKIAAVGDSTTAGYRALAATQSWPVLLRTALAAAGYPTMGTGPVVGNPGGAPGGFLDGRYTFSGTWTTQAGNANFLLQTIVNGATATFASDVAGTIVEIKYLNNGGTFSYAIDGGAAVPVTPSGAGSIGTVTVTGLANTTHSVVITATSTSAFYLPWVDVRGATSGVLVANFGVNSSMTAHWTNNTFYYPGPMSQSWGPNVTFIDLGINDLAGAVTTATYKANLQTLITAYAALGDVFLVIGNPTQSGDRSAYNAACYQLADSNDIPLIDLMERLGTWASMNVQGLAADASHPNAAGYVEKFAGIFAALDIPIA